MVRAWKGSGAVIGAAGGLSRQLAAADGIGMGIRREPGPARAVENRWMGYREPPRMELRLRLDAEGDPGKN